MPRKAGAARRQRFGATDRGEPGGRVCHHEPGAAGPRGGMNGFRAILMKEIAHIRRDWSTIFFALLVPSLQMIIFGFAIKTTIENIPVVVFDLDGKQDSRRLVEALVAS